jgi:hypothetical protein
MPCRRLLALSRHWFDAATAERVFEPLVADWEHELRSTSGVARRLRSISGTIHFAIAFAAQLLRDQLRPLPAGLGGTAFICVECCLTAAALVIAVLLQAGAIAFGYPAFHTYPPNLAMAAPLGAIPGNIVMLRYSTWPAADVRRAMLRIAFIELAIAAVIQWL